MKKMIAILLVLAVAFSLTACDQASSPVPSAPVSTETKTKIDASEVGSVNVKSGLVYVTITIPAELVNKEKTQEFYDEQAQQNSYRSVTLNADGSVTYVMTKSQHQEMLDKLKIEF